MYSVAKGFRNPEESVALTENTSHTFGLYCFNVKLSHCSQTCFYISAILLTNPSPSTPPISTFSLLLPANSPTTQTLPLPAINEGTEDS